MNAHFYFDIDQGEGIQKNNEAKNDKRKIHVGFSNYSKFRFWSILLGHFIKHKPLISEEWVHIE